MQGVPFSQMEDLSHSLTCLKGPRMRTWTMLERITSVECSPPTPEVCVNGLYSDDGVHLADSFTLNSTRRCTSFNMKMSESTCGFCGCPVFSLHSWKDTTTDLHGTVVTDCFTQMTTAMCFCSMGSVLRNLPSPLRRSVYMKYVLNIASSRMNLGQCLQTLMSSGARQETAELLVRQWQRSLRMKASECSGATMTSPPE